MRHRHSAFCAILILSFSIKLSFGQMAPDWELNDIPQFAPIPNVTVDIVGYHNHARVTIKNCGLVQGTLDLDEPTVKNNQWWRARFWSRTLGQEGLTLTRLGSYQAQDYYWGGHAIIAEFKPDKKMKLEQFGHVQAVRRTHPELLTFWLGDLVLPSSLCPCYNGLGAHIPNKYQKNEVVVMFDLPGVALRLPSSGPFDGDPMPKGAKPLEEEKGGWFRTWPVGKAQGDPVGGKVPGKSGVVPGYWGWGYLVQVKVDNVDEGGIRTYSLDDARYKLLANPIGNVGKEFWREIPFPYVNPEPIIVDAMAVYTYIVKVACGLRHWQWNGAWPPLPPAQYKCELPAVMEAVRTYSEFTMEGWR